jgi:F-type H+-transporting ATPase subunit delta
MPRRETAARRYAEAAFELAREADAFDAWERDLRELGRVMAVPELREVIEHPAVPYGEKAKVLRRAVGERIAAEPIGLVLLMVRRGRPSAVPTMIERFEDLVRRERGIARAEVRTALPLDDQQRNDVVERLGELTAKRIEVSEIVDESLIGGISVRIGDILYDASVRARLERLRARLTAV